MNHIKELLCSGYFKPNLGTAPLTNPTGARSNYAIYRSKNVSNSELSNYLVESAAKGMMKEELIIFKA
jgi:hypothetical protein